MITQALDGTPMFSGKVTKGEPVLLKIPTGCDIPPTWPPPPHFYHQVVVAYSGGKDSRVLLLHALTIYPKERIVVLLNLMGDDHDGVVAEARDMCDLLGLRICFTWKDKQRKTHYGTEPPEKVDDLMMSLVRRNKARLDRKSDHEQTPWPGGNAPICTSEGKQGPTDVVFTHMGAARTLLLTGERRQESTVRKGHAAFAVRLATPTVPRLVLWHRLILDWTLSDVLGYLDELNIPLPEAYSQGYSRYSCTLCWTKRQEEQVLSFYYSWQRAAERVALELEMRRPYQKYTYQGTTGWLAVWEQTYGAWTGIPRERPPVRPEALALIENLRKPSSAT